MDTGEKLLELCKLDKLCHGAIMTGPTRVMLHASYQPHIIQPTYYLAVSVSGHGDRAAFHYQEAVRLKPSHYVAMVNLGRLLRSSNDNKEAELWYKR